MKVLRATVFFLIIPGTVLFYLPALLAALAPRPEQPSPVLRLFGGLAWAAGGLICLWVIAAFAHQGQGTPAPNAATQTLVASGLYRLTRNPMYLGAWLIVSGYFLWFQSWALLAYAALVLFFFHGLVIYYEEPHLRRQFGQAYQDYCQKTPRWLGRPG